MRATLPPKPGSSNQRSSQQRIALGIHANPAGVRLAEAEARKIGALLDCGEFDWTAYLKSSVETPETCSSWIERFEQSYVTRREKTPKSETTWQKDYWNIFSKLPPSAPLTPEVVLTTVESTKPDSKTRKRACMALGALAKFANQDVDLKSLRGRYNPSSVEPRDIPSDELIAEWFYKIPNPKWQWVYGVLATYGIRPSEFVYCDLREFPIMTVLDGKTGGRLVWPCYPEWADQFGLSEMKFPKVSGSNNGDRGHRVTTQFSRYEVPFSPKMLRHAWAVRTLRFKIDISIAAQQLGHSVEVHSKIYHRWITKQHHQEAFEKAMLQGDRPLPP